VQDTEIGVVPTATLLRHPGILFPDKVNVTRPATETTEVIVVDTPLAIELDTSSVTEIAALELFVMIRGEIASN
jgi:hypothetical protein